MPEFRTFHVKILEVWSLVPDLGALPGVKPSQNLPVHTCFQLFLKGQKVGWDLTEDVIAKQMAFYSTLARSGTQWSIIFMFLKRFLCQ